MMLMLAQGWCDERSADRGWGLFVLLPIGQLKGRGVANVCSVLSRTVSWAGLGGLFNFARLSRDGDWDGGWWWCTRYSCMTVVV